MSDGTECRLVGPWGVERGLVGEELCSYACLPQPRPAVSPIVAVGTAPPVGSSWRDQDGAGTGALKHCQPVSFGAQ